MVAVGFGCQGPMRRTEAKALGGEELDVSVIETAGVGIAARAEAFELGAKP
jgi:hypothetical protein